MINMKLTKTSKINTDNDIIQAMMDDYRNLLYTQREYIIESYLRTIEQSIYSTEAYFQKSSVNLTNIIPMSKIIANVCILLLESDNVKLDLVNGNYILINTDINNNINYTIKSIRHHTTCTLLVYVYDSNLLYPILISDAYIYSLYKAKYEKLKEDNTSYNNLTIEGHSDTWYSFAEKEIFGKLYLFLENEKHGDEVYHMIYNYTDKKVMVTGQGISWLDLKDKLLDEFEAEIIKNI